MPESGKTKRYKPPAPKPVTASYLRNAAMHYIASRAASAAMVRQTLERRAMRRLAVRTLDTETSVLIETTVSQLVELGLIDDQRFAEIRTATLTAKGLPPARIAQGLRAKGLAAETVAEAVGEDIDTLQQARRFVARKRLGPFRRGGMTPETRRRDLGALARAGFGFAVASQALDDPEPDEESG